MALPAVSSTQVQKAHVELERMKSSLRSWLKYRTLNDQVVLGQKKTKLPPTVAARAVASYRDLAVEQDLASKLYTLLSELEVKGLPNPDLSANPNAAVQLAQIAINGGQMPHPMGGILSASSASHPWLWPVLIVGGLLLAVTTAVKTAADVAKEREHYACIQSGACTDYGFWLKAGGVVAIGWFAWRELGLGDVIKGLIKKRGS